jgi:hypothetical protein
MASDDRIVLSRLSGVFWSGSARDLRDRFRTPQQFRDFVIQGDEPGGSPVYRAVSETLAYVLDQPGVKAGKTKAGVLVFSDFDDNASGPGAKEHLLRLLPEFRAHGGRIALYWVSRPHVAEWRSHLLKAGFANPVVISDIEASAPLPSFD